MRNGGLQVLKAHANMCHNSQTLTSLAVLETGLQGRSWRTSYSSSSSAELVVFAQRCVVLDCQTVLESMRMFQNIQNVHSCELT